MLDEKAYENISIYDVSHKTLISAKPLRTMFDKVNGFIRDFGGFEHLILFSLEIYDVIYNRMRSYNI